MQNMSITPQNIVSAVNFSSRKSWALLAVFCLVLPPLGVFIMLYCLYKYFKNPRGKSFLALALVLLISTMVGLAAYWQAANLWRQYYRYHYTYIRLENTAVKSDLTNGSISFQKPPELKQVSSTKTQGFSSVYFAHSETRGSSKFTVSYLSALSVQSALAASKDYIAGLSKIYSDSSSDNYFTHSAPIEKFVLAHGPDRAEVQLQPAQPFTNPNIKQNAWQFDFTTTDKLKKYSPIKGKALLLVGERSFYYFLVSSDTYDWNSNQAIWQKVIDSIKIDQ